MGRNDLPAEILYEHRVTAYLEQRLRDLNCAFTRQEVEPGRANLIATYQSPGPAPFTVVFEAHQDTVPVDGMTVDPFGGHVEGGRLYGRGACDVKAGVTVMLHAFERLVRERPAGSANVILAFTVDEEHTFLGVQALVKHGLKADYAIVAEPTLMRIVNTHKGVLRWQMETTGQACHSSRPELGINAVYRMAKVLQAIEAYGDVLRRRPQDPLLGSPTISVGRIVGGTSPNTVPDFCRIDIDRRLIPSEPVEGAVQELEQFIRGYPGIDFPIISHPLKLNCPALSAEASGPLVSRLSTAIRSVIGSAEVMSVPYGTDASTIALAGIPSVVFGPGDIAQAHTKDEWIDLAQLEPACEILYRLATLG